MLDVICSKNYHVIKGVDSSFAFDVPSKDPMMERQIAGICTHKTVGFIGISAWECRCHTFHYRFIFFPSLIDGDLSIGILFTPESSVEVTLNDFLCGRNIEFMSILLHNLFRCTYFI